MLWQQQLPEEYRTLDDGQLAQRITRRREELSSQLVILGHHYQRDDVIQHADFTGDSFKLSQLAAERATETGAKTIVFCGVHFMAEAADILTPGDVDVILPDLTAGCSMADMADCDDTQHAWKVIHKVLKAADWKGRVIPITYMNSSAAIKAFCGEHGGAVCTSSNAGRVFEWAMAGGTTKKKSREKIKLLFLPDQHLGRNTAHAFGINVKRFTTLWDPQADIRGEHFGGTTEEAIIRARVILWKGHCSVHQLFRAEHIRALRATDPDRKIIVHPECPKEVVDDSDEVGSTELILNTIRASKKGSAWAVGTEMHLVNRVAREMAEQGVDVQSLGGSQCLCTTMYRIDPQHVLWVLDNLAQGTVVNKIAVDPKVKEYAMQALGRMLELTAQPTTV